jgi:lipase chaperone LimK
MRPSPQTNSKSATPTGLIEPKRNRYTLESARIVLNLTFSEESQRLVHELLKKNQADRISPNEKEDLDHFIKANTHLSTLQSKARVFLKNAGRLPQAG